MEPKDLEDMHIPDMMTMAEEKLSDGLMIIETILFEATPKDPEKKDDIAMLQDFYDTTLKAFDRCETTFWEIIGGKALELIQGKHGTM